jgi:hypothetical protein
MTFSTPHIGHSRHGLFFTRWIANQMLNLLKRTMTYPGFEPGTFGLAVSIANHYTVHNLGRLMYYELESKYKKSSKFEEVMVQNQKKNVSISNGMRRI